MSLGVLSWHLGSGLSVSDRTVFPFFRNKISSAELIHTSHLKKGVRLSSQKRDLDATEVEPALPHRPPRSSPSPSLAEISQGKISFRTWPACFLSPTPHPAHCLPADTTPALQASPRSEVLTEAAPRPSLFCESDTHPPNYPSISHRSIHPPTSPSHTLDASLGSCFHGYSRA